MTGGLALITLTACVDSGPTARFVNGCDGPVEVMATEWDGERDPSLFSHTANRPDQVIATLQPAESWDFSRQGAGDNYVAVVMYDGDQDVYFWSVTSSNRGVFELTGAACPPQSAGAPTP